MLTIKFFVVFVALALLGPIRDVPAQVNLGLSVGEEGLRSFHLGIGEYFRVPEREVIIIRERRIPEQEIPVVFLIAQRARVAPAAIVDLRQRGRSWLNITIHYGLSPEIYYVPMPATVRVGPPYGKAYGHFKNKPKKEWKTIVLSDGDVINLVNLKFVSEHYGRPPEEVIRLRSSGKQFVVLHDEVRKEKEGKGKKSRDHGDDDRRGEGSKGKGQEKGKGHQKDKN